MVTTAVLARERVGTTGSSAGMLPALVSAATFGLAGSLARSLLDIGWSPAAVVVARVGGAFLVLLLPCLMLVRRIGLPSARQIQAGWSSTDWSLSPSPSSATSAAVQYLSIGVALLLEYLAPVLLIGWHWARNRRRPAPRVLPGSGIGPGRTGAGSRPDRRSRAQPDRRRLGSRRGRLPLCLLRAERGGRGLSPDPSAAADHGRHRYAVELVGRSARGAPAVAAAVTARTGQTLVAGHAVTWLLPAALLILVSCRSGLPHRYRRDPDPGQFGRHRSSPSRK